jgi:ABC-2 type transport system ATP-binding protein
VIVEFKNVNKVFDKDLLQKKFIALDGMSARFPEHKTTALLGHNGAGKTTAIRCLLGLTRINSGAIYFKGKPLDASGKRLIGYMPEVNKLPKELSPYEILRIHHGLYCKNRPFSKDKVMSALEGVGVKSAAHKKIRELSKGMARRVAWAQACYHEPELLVLDEPLSGLDPVARLDMIEWIRAYKDKGSSIIFCTHELWTVREICDEVNVFKDGRLVYTSLDGDQRLLSSHYHLVLSGVNPQQIQDWQTHMPPYEIEAKGAYLVKMNLSTYEDACKWLNKVMAQGVIVVKFSDELDVGDNFVADLLRRSE